MLDWTNQAKISIAISEPANCRIDCSPPLIFFFNAKISNAENSERERAVGALLLSPLVKPFCARVQISRNPLCAGFNSNGKKIEGCEQILYSAAHFARDIFELLGPTEHCNTPLRTFILIGPNIN